MRIPDYAIGSDSLPGLAKLVEEMGELQQAVAILMAFPDRIRPDGTQPWDRVSAEIADVLAAVDYLMWANTELAVRSQSILFRREAKFNRFLEWHNKERTL